MKNKIDIGIPEKNRKAIADGLSRLMADVYTLYVKTQGFHWNITGPHFSSLHALFETHYVDLAAAVDLIAERIRALGFYAPGSYGQFAKLATIKEENKVPDWQGMVEQLIAGHETVIRTARSLLEAVEQASDEVTLSLLGERMNVHEKTVWMLRSLLS